MSNALCAVSALLFFITTFAACGSTTTPEPVVAAVERPGQPWPSDVPRCTIQRLEEASTCGAKLAIFEDSDGSSPIAIISRPEKVDLTWRELPIAGRGDRAKVDVFAPILFSGWASLDHAAFTLTQDVDIRSKHLTAKAWTSVAVVGTTRDKVVVRVPTVFKTPNAMEIEVDCHALKAGYSAETPRPPKSTKGHVRPRNNATIQLRESLEGPTVMSFEPEPDQPLWLIGQREGAIRIAGGIGPGKIHPSSTAIFFDGWADVRHFFTLDKLPRRSELRSCPSYSNEPCQDGHGQTKRDAMLYYGDHPPGEHFATIKLGTPLLVDEQLGDLLAVSFVRDVVEAPRGIRYFIKRDAMGLNCGGEGQDLGAERDGCPPCPHR